MPLEPSLITRKMNSEAKIPEHLTVYSRLKEMILLGRFAPGQALTIFGLVEEMGAGTTPVREALRRLTAEHALTSLENRRIIVPELSEKDINDIYFLRLIVEPELTRQSTKNMTGPIIDQLRDIDTQINDALEHGDVEAYLEGNNRFHFAIYDTAQSQVLFQTARSLWVQIGPSLRIVCGRYGTANMPDKHSELLDALSRGDENAAAQAMRDDLEQSRLLISAP